MTKLQSVSTLLALVWGLMVATHTAHAQTTGYKQRGNLASVVATKAVDPCVTWSVIENLSAFVTKTTETGAKEKTNDVVFVFQWTDNCNQDSTFVQVQIPGAATFAGNLDSATARVDTQAPISICVFDDAVGFQRCTEGTTQVTGTLTWTGSGPIENQKTVFVHRLDGFYVRNVTAGNSRASTVSGSVTVNGQTYAVSSADTVDSTLTTAKQGNLSIVRQ